MRCYRPSQGGIYGRAVPGATAPSAILRASHLPGLALENEPEEGRSGERRNLNRLRYVRPHSDTIWDSGEAQVFALVEQAKDDAALKKELREKMSGIIPEAQIEAQILVLTSPWFRYFQTYDPATALRSVQCPVLALNGERDLQVSPKQNLPSRP